MKTRYVLQVAILLSVMSLCGSAFGTNVCSFPNGVVSVSPALINMPNTGGPSAFSVSAVPTCTWTASTNLPYVHITSQAGIGSGNVNFTVDANPDLAVRGDQNFAFRIHPHDGNDSFVGLTQAAASGDFSVSISPTSVTLAPGGGLEFTVTWTRTGGFNGNITPSLSALPNGMHGTFRNNTTLLDISTDATIICPTNSSNNTMTVSGQNGNVIRSAQAHVNVGGDFSLSVNPSSLSVVQGRSAAPMVTITRSGNYGNAITLSSSGSPNGVGVTFNPNNTAGNSSALNVTASATSSIGTTPITITGTGGCLTHTIPYTLTISPAWWPAIEEILTK
jgi:hypothetical protein